ncbi:MAG: hypothetical protein O3C57_05405 [Verrucomicrobia bacterium]|nr:hypothetical protein [Verrucomicrobiota bacterium]
MSRKPTGSVRGLAALFLAAVVIIGVDSMLRDALRPAAFYSGWALLVCLVLLALYNIRKKLPSPPLISSRIWLRAHVLGGYLAALLFLVHAGVRAPTGGLETVLYVSFALLVITGITGSLLSRSFAKRLTTSGQEIIFERIPIIRRSLGDEARSLCLNSVVPLESRVLATFYRERLRDFFAAPRHIIHHIFNSKRPLNNLLRELRGVRRFAGDTQVNILQNIEDLIVTKDKLDYQYALQLVLKGWLFIHIPTTVVVIGLMLLHVRLVYGFTGGL